MSTTEGIDLPLVERTEAPDAAPAQRVGISILLPAFNEADNLRDLVPEIVESLEALGDTYEIVVVDDGSRDGTRAVMSELATKYPNLHYTRLRRNAGKSVALAAGFARVRGDVVVLMDADGQDVPAEIGTLVGALGPDCDLVTGRRAERHDRFIKRHTSKVYNYVTARVSGVPGRDFNSGFKAMKRQVATDLDLYGELHRYIPVLAQWAGYRVAEIDVEHRERMHGTSKFGRSRFWRGLLDLLVVKFLTTYNSRPFHFFGGVGLFLGAVGTGLLMWMGILRLAGDRVGDRPALLVGVLCVVVSVQLLSLGLIASLVIHQRQARDAPPVGDAW